MWKRIALGAAVAVVILGAIGASITIGALPSAAVRTTQPQIDAAEHAAVLAELRPPKRQRPVIAVIGINNATETTDYLVPAGILRRADVADVFTVATGPGPVKLYPALTVEPDLTTAGFDKAYPAGADYVVVPAMEPDNDPAVLQWIRQQQASGAIIVGVCVGAVVVSEAGLLDGRRATTHWYELNGMLTRHPQIEYVADRRFVVDDGIVTTTGITASIPTMLTLIEAIAGRERALTVAADVGVASWDARHDSGAFRMIRPFALTVVANSVALWNHEELAIALEPGMDEVALGLVADLWSRTYRSKTFSFSPSGGPVLTANGISILPDREAAAVPGDRVIRFDPDEPATAVLNRHLNEVGARYGADTRQVVALQLEY